MIAQHGDKLRYVPLWDKWHLWDGARWAVDEKMQAWHLAHRVCTEVAAAVELTGLQRTLASAHTRAAVISLCGQHPRIATTSAQWDADPMILNTPGGTIDLRTGVTRSNLREDYCTKMTKVAPDPNCPTPTWDAHLMRVFNNNAELIKYLYKILGYCLTGDVSEDIVVFCHGVGNSGKTTTMSVLFHVFGDYAVEAPIEMFLEQRHGLPVHPTELTILRGARLAIASEPDKGRKFSEARIKKLSGGGQITARGMRQDFYTFEMTAKVMFEGEHQPALGSVDAGHRRRWRILPFAGGIQKGEEDKEIDEKLEKAKGGPSDAVCYGCYGLSIMDRTAL